MTRIAAVVLAALLALGPAASAAQPSRKKAIWGPIERDGVSQFPIYRELGVGIFQMTLSWRDAAPTRPAAAGDPGDPAYRWPADVDHALREAGRHGIRVALVVGGTPAWANGGRDAAWRPTRARDLAAFLRAAARRYPGVRLWMIWGEPNKPSNLQPGGLRSAPRAYAPLLDAAYGALKAVSPRNLVIGGNTWTSGTPGPRDWIRRLRLADGRRPRMDLYGHNPFGSRSPDLARDPRTPGTADFSDLDTLSRWVDRWLGPAPSGRPIRIFVSEFALPTGHPNNSFWFHVTERTQARWIAAALRIARGWSRIYTFGYQGLYDPDPAADGQQPDWGLMRSDGSRKPAFTAYMRG